MEDDKTRFMHREDDSLFDQPALEVIYTSMQGNADTRLFTERLLIGRGSQCDISIPHTDVSRQHVEIYPIKGDWVLKDLGSTNGTLLNNRNIQTEKLPNLCTIQLGGVSGPVLTLRQVARMNSPEKLSDTQQLLTKDQVYEHYLTENPGRTMGEHTRMVRRVFREVQDKKARRYRSFIAAFAMLFFLVAGFSIYQQVRLHRAQEIALDMFYDMKSIEVQLAQAEIRIQESGTLPQRSGIREKRAQLEEMESRYQNYLQELESFRLLKKKFGREQELIVRVARAFGESELEVPEEFGKEVMRYIGEWRKSDRLAMAISRMRRQGHQQEVLQELEQNGLPKYFIFLPLQESNYRVDAIGPETRFGIAKGAWQFIPTTATEYGLRVAPLAALPKYDEADERFDFEKSTKAATQYLKDIYSKEAQASGLLVLASYNWGHNKVRTLVKSMPENPRDRNFWKLIKQYKIPKETYDYVFYIFSAAVISEDPAYFGFDFDNPFAG